MPTLPKGIHLPPFVMAPEDIEEIALRIEGNLEKGSLEYFLPIPTGFATFDNHTGGGLHGGDLNIVGGVQNIGKTALCLQWANHIALQDAHVIFVCYEHNTETLFERLICQNSYEGDPANHITPDLIRSAYIDTIQERDRVQIDDPDQKLYMLDEVLSCLPRGSKAWSKLTDRMHNIWLITGDGLNTDLDALKSYVELATAHYNKKRIVLFIDYVQRVPVIDTSRALEANERIERVLAGLKGLAMAVTRLGIVMSVVAVGAADAQGLRLGRIHLENLWGSSLMQYEPDTALIGNRDDCSEDGNIHVRWAIEKNRRGPSNIEFRHAYHGSALWFEPDGIMINDDESWQSERDMDRITSKEMTNQNG